jgi:diadenosine tetraphosphate (Ap4A) HIT family hydrolase
MLEYIKPEETILRNDLWTVTLLYKQLYLGSHMIILNRQCDSLPQLTSKEWLSYITIVTSMELAIKSAFNADLFNYNCLMNHGYRHNPPQPWVHWWVRPRYSSKQIFQGVEFNDIEFGSFYDRDTEHELPIIDFDQPFRNGIVKEIQKYI